MSAENCRAPLIQVSARMQGPVQEDLLTCGQTCSRARISHVQMRRVHPSRADSVRNGQKRPSAECDAGGRDRRVPIGGQGGQREVSGEVRKVEWRLKTLIHEAVRRARPDDGQNTVGWWSNIGPTVISTLPVRAGGPDTPGAFKNGEGGQSKGQKKTAGTAGAEVKSGSEKDNK